MRYLLFAGHEVHARGGWADFQGGYADLHELMGALKAWRWARDANPLVWWQVVDTASLTVIHTQDIQ